MIADHQFIIIFVTIIVIIVLIAMIVMIVMIVIIVIIIIIIITRELSVLSESKDGAMIADHIKDVYYDRIQVESILKDR